jgi:hypothetical protein
MNIKYLRLPETDHIENECTDSEEAQKLANEEFNKKSDEIKDFIKEWVK